MRFSNQVGTQGNGEIISVIADSVSRCNITSIELSQGNHLHSHGIAWGSGSGQQSVTTNSVKNDKSKLHDDIWHPPFHLELYFKRLQSELGSLWLLKEGFYAEQCEIGKPIACGDIIRLEHVDTRKNLHSHLFKAPLSGNQEVSAFGDEFGNGDTGDNWEVSLYQFVH